MDPLPPDPTLFSGVQGVCAGLRDFSGLLLLLDCGDEHPDRQAGEWE